MGISLLLLILRGLADPKRLLIVFLVDIAELVMKADDATIVVQNIAFAGSINRIIGSKANNELSSPGRASDTSRLQQTTLPGIPLQL